MGFQGVDSILALVNAVMNCPALEKGWELLKHLSEILSSQEGLFSMKLVC